ALPVRWRGGGPGGDRPPRPRGGSRAPGRSRHLVRGPLAPQDRIRDRPLNGGPPRILLPMSARFPRALSMLALSCLGPTALGASAPAAHAVTHPRGIDVSMWQKSIDWPTVATTNTRFVIIRATKGTTYEDPTFSANLAGAEANGIEVGAYH